jgi:hypothetical protein
MVDEVNVNLVNIADANTNITIDDIGMMNAVIWYSFPFKPAIDPKVRDGHSVQGTCQPNRFRLLQPL